MIKGSKTSEKLFFLVKYRILSSLASLWSQLVTTLSPEPVMRGLFYKALFQGVTSQKSWEPLV